MPNPKYPQRDYGLDALGDPTRAVRGVPRVTGKVDAAGAFCPHCGCDTVYQIEVNIEHPMLTTGKGVGTYVGCPACPYASPMLTQAVSEWPGVGRSTTG